LSHTSHTRVHPGGSFSRKMLVSMTRRRRISVRGRSELSARYSSDSLSVCVCVSSEKSVCCDFTAGMHNILGHLTMYLYNVLGYSLLRDVSGVARRLSSSLNPE
jgi:hypothetical protein